MLGFIRRVSNFSHFLVVSVQMLGSTRCRNLKVPSSDQEKPKKTRPQDSEFLLKDSEWSLPLNPTSDIESKWLLMASGVNDAAFLTFKGVLLYVQVFAFDQSTYRRIRLFTKSD